MSSRQSWKLAEAFARGQQVLRQEGPRALWFKVWGELGYRRLILFEAHFAEARKPPEVLPNPELIWLSPDRVADLQRLRPEASDELTRRHLRAGRRCMIGFVAGEAVYSSWVASGTAWVEYLELGLRLAGDSYYSYATFVHPAWRQHGLALWMSWRRRVILSEEGLTRTVCAVMPENRLGERLIRGVGYRKLGMARTLRVGGVQSAWLSHNVAGLTIEDVPPDLRC